MPRFFLRSLVVAATVVFCAFPAMAEEITLFNSKGDAIAYIDTDEEMTVYLWKGKPVAYLEKGSLWGFNGDHLGWFDKGVIHDHDGYTVGCIKDAIEMTYQVETFKSFKQFKSFKTLEPLKPQWKNKWSVTPLSLFLAGGEK